MNRFHVVIPDKSWFEEHVGCEDACPVNTCASQYISLILRRDYNREDNLFPAILGRTCVHPHITKREHIDLARKGVLPRL